MSLSAFSREHLVVGQLEHPAGAKGQRIAWPYLITIALYHLVALLAFLPWFFSWTGVIVAWLGLLVFGTFGINICYHRLLTHRGFTCVTWLERCLAILGICCVQDTPIHWVAVHRRHHQYSDEQSDPHSPFVNFLWAHIGWLLIENRDFDRLGLYSRYARDIAQNPFYSRFERVRWYAGVIYASWLLFFLGGLVAGVVIGSSLMESVQFGLSLLVWGVFVRTVVVWHITWSVNSITHIWGYRRYTTGDGSRNNILIGYISSGEGWHNNHHADPRTAKNGRRWWEFDFSYLLIRCLAAFGLANDIVMPNPRVAEELSRSASK